MTETLRKLFRKPTPVEKAVRELGTIEHAMLDVGAEIMWAQKRLEYYQSRASSLRTYVAEKSK